MSKRHVGIALARRNGFYAFLQRTDGQWTFPGGKANDGEAPELAAVRETLEESGLRVVLRECLGKQEKENKLRHYYVCDVVGGALKLAEPDKFLQACWKSPEEIIDLVGDRLTPFVRTHLERETARAPRPACTL